MYKEKPYLDCWNEAISRHRELHGSGGDVFISYDILLAFIELFGSDIIPLQPPATKKSYKGFVHDIPVTVMPSWKGAVIVTVWRDECGYQNN